MKNNKTFTLIALIIFLQFFNINLRADDLNKIDKINEFDWTLVPKLKVTYGRTV